MQLLLRKYWI